VTDVLPDHPITSAEILSGGIFNRGWSHSHLPTDGTALREGWEGGLDSEGDENSGHWVRSPATPSFNTSLILELFRGFSAFQISLSPASGFGLVIDFLKMS
jgi:hypothetical protein